MNDIDRILAEVRAEIERQEDQWGGSEHDEQLHVNTWVCIVTKQLGLAFTQDQDPIKYPHERGVDARFIKIAAIAVSAVRSVRSTYR
jgi:hypothetical protein